MEASKAEEVPLFIGIDINIHLAPDANLMQMDFSGPAFIFLRKCKLYDAMTQVPKSKAFGPSPSNTTLLEFVQSINAIRDHAHNSLALFGILVLHCAAHGFEEVRLQHLR